VTDWNVIIEQTARASGVRPGVILSGRNIALMHLAMHDTLNAIGGRYASYRVHRSSPGANPQAAVVAAGYGVAVRLYPDQVSSLANFNSKMLGAIPDGPGKDEGLMLGDEVAAEMVALRANDHFDYATPAGEPFVGELDRTARDPALGFLRRILHIRMPFLRAQAWSLLWH
jgi:hypothetical protein